MFPQIQTQILFLFIYIKTVLSIRPETIEFSVDNTTISPSTIYKNLKPSIVTSITKPAIGHRELTIIKGVKTEVDKGVGFSFKIPYLNSDTSGDRLQLLMGAQSGELVAFNKILINHTNFTGIVPSHPQYYVPKVEISDPPTISCEYTQNNLKYTINRIQHVNSFTKIKKYYYLTFGLIENKLYFLSSKKENEVNIVSLSSFERGSNNLDNLVVEDFFTIPYTSNKGYLAVVVQESANYNIHIFQIKDSMVAFDMFTLTFIKTINGNTSKIHKIGFYNGKFIIAKENKLQDEENGVIISKEVIDFAINSNYIYCIVKREGLYIINLLHPDTDVKTYIHQRMKQIDLFINPFTGYQYLGIRTDNDNANEGEEFFIEFLLYNQNTVLLNKLFTSKNIDYLQFFTLDSFFSFFFNKEDNKLYIIRRGMLNSAPFQTYYIDLTDKLSQSTETPLFISAIYNQTSEKHIPIFVTDKNYYIINNFETPNHFLNCSFNTDGDVLLRFIQYGDACEASIQSKEDKFTLCEKLIDFNFQIKSRVDGEIVKVLIWVVSVLFALVTFFIIVSLLNTTNCCKTDKNLKVKVGINKDDRGKIYEDEEEEEEDEDSDDDNFNDYEINENAFINKRKVKVFSNRRSQIPSSNRGLMDDMVEGSTSRRDNNDDLIEDNYLHQANEISNKVYSSKEKPDEKPEDEEDKTDFEKSDLEIGENVERTQNIATRNPDKIDTKLYSKTKF